MNLFKNKKCEHQYSLYDISYVYLYFICKICQKEIKIDVGDIIKTLDDFALNEKKMLAIDKLYDIKKSKLMIPKKNFGHCIVVYDGVYVTLAIDYYKNKGIDLNDIDKYYKSGNSKIDFITENGKTVYLY
jgi:hypothetical protein